MVIEPPTVDVAVVRVRTVATIESPAVRSLIIRAIAATEYPGTTAEDLYAEWAANVANRTQGVFIGLDDRVPVGVAVAVLPTSHTMFAPILLLAYNEGRSALARRVGERVRAWVLEAGYDKIMGHNLYRDDDVFIRGFRRIAPMGRVIGSLVEFKF